MTDAQNIDLLRAQIRDQLPSANVNQNSFLATDYLNHFNEVYMLLEMIPDMPDMLDEILDWKPKSYIEHFRDSNLQAKHLIIEAYHLCPDSYRLRFDRLVARLDAFLLDTIEAAQIARAQEKIIELRYIVQMRMENIEALISAISAVINDTTNANDQQAIDDLLDDDFTPISMEVNSLKLSN